MVSTTLYHSVLYVLVLRCYPKVKWSGMEKKVGYEESVLNDYASCSVLEKLVYVRLSVGQCKLMRWFELYQATVACMIRWLYVRGIIRCRVWYDMKAELKMLSLFLRWLCLA
jgi:hypothetical protein